MSDDKTVDPWLRDQHGHLGDGYMVVDDVTLPGVLAREVAVEYSEDPKASWPIRVTVSFYLDELKVDPKIAEHVVFTTALSGPRAEGG